MSIKTRLQACERMLDDPEYLRKRLNELTEIADKAYKEKWYPYMKKFEGKTYRGSNTYGGGGKRWPIYYKILPINKEDIYYIQDESKKPLATAHIRVAMFEIDCNGNVEIAKERSTYLHSVTQYKRISENEYTKAWNKLIDHLNNF